MAKPSTIKQFAKRHKHPLILFGIYLFGIFLFSLLLFFTHRLLGSDDYAFQAQIRPFATVFDWTHYRYESWSGRIFAESFVYIFSPLPLIFWKLVSVSLYALFSGYLFLYYRLFTKNRSHLKDYLMMVAALALPLLMDTRVLTEGMLWVTGSMNYFWLIAFAVAGFYPIAHYVITKHRPNLLVSIIGILSTIIAASSQEQIGAIFCTLAVIFTIYTIIINKKKFPFYIIGFSLVSVLAFMFGINAPGNDARIYVETVSKLPDFYTLPLLEHIKYAYRWFLDSLINRFGVLFAASWILLLALFANKKKTLKLDKLDYLIITILGSACLFLCLKGFENVSYWFNFYATWKVQAPRTSYITILAWTIPLLATLIAPVVLYRKNINGYLLGILYGAVLASTALITLSPTMYASGFRILFVPSIILGFIILILLNRVYDQYKTFTKVFILAIILLAGSQYLSLIAHTQIQ